MIPMPLFLCSDGRHCPEGPESRQMQSFSEKHPPGTCKQEIPVPAQSHKRDELTPFYKKLTVSTLFAHSIFSHLSVFIYNFVI